MHHPIDTGAACEPDFHFLGDTACEPQAPPAAPSLPNASMMGVVTLDARGEFVSSRQLTQDELADAWAQHNARHGKG